MTRQNQIPIDSQKFQLALIPVWDMANHQNGKITTFYNLGSSTCECQAVANFNAGEQVKIFYGARPNSELLIYSGFVFKENIHDYLMINLEIPKDDPLEKVKQIILDQHNLRRSFFMLKNPIPQEILAFSRVVALNKEEIKNEKLREDLLKGPINEKNEVEANKFLVDKCQELLTRYQAEETYKNLLSSPNLRQKSAALLITLEKSILQKVITPKKKKSKKKNMKPKKINDEIESKEKVEKEIQL
jgi:hypothetical protein